MISVNPFEEKDHLGSDSESQRTRDLESSFGEDEQEEEGPIRITPFLPKIELN